jgi:hypothetical protein
MGNCFRMFLHGLAHNFLVRVRQAVARPPKMPLIGDLQPEAFKGRDRRRCFNQRRQADPLGEGHACTWRMMLIKVAARIRATARRVFVELSGSWPLLAHYQHVADCALRLPSAAFDTS